MKLAILLTLMSSLVYASGTINVRPNSQQKKTVTAAKDFICKDGESLKDCHMRFKSQHPIKK